MTPQNLNPADLLSAAYGLFAGIFAAARKLNGTVDEGLTMRNRYYELSGLSNASLQAAGLNRNDIPHIVAAEAGLFTPNEVVPANSNEASSVQVA